MQPFDRLEFAMINPARGENKPRRPFGLPQVGRLD
jgi:hypothetical protein